MTTDAADTITEAQLYWDRQDPQAAGWWLRYRDDRGNEQGCAVDGDEDATTEELASAVGSVTDDGVTGAVRVFRGDEARGRIVLEAGKVVSWRAG